MPGYVIYLSTEIETDFGGNNYGYWTGKTYRHEDVVYPGCEDDKYDESVKVYKFKKSAEKMTEKLGERFTYVRSSVVEEV
ncbi:hypothetical protein MPH47_04255 [Psychrobacillus psychrodurans]|uniref:hypothetical protein n=1 Tax=Psychrobacillus psychrodurans TaxID=126157 RepID=UPI001F4DF5FE|nr:hypothetical protein [Psychrobacillus psychrodurans]MCK1996458.1 hypothetical protein [Psychrobacillus psychrodurans]